MDWKFVVVFLVLLWPALQLLRVFAVAKVLLGLRLGAAKVHQLAPPAIPRFLLAAAAEETKRLAQLGFQLKQGLRLESASGPGFDTLLLDFAHPSESIRALVRPHASSQRSGECWISFLTFRVDGPSIVTAAHTEVEIGEDLRDVDQETLFGADALVLLNRHRERVAAAAQAGAWLLDANKRAVALHHAWRIDSEVERLAASGEVTRNADGTVRWKFFRAFGTAARFLLAERRRVKSAGAALKKVSTALIPPDALNEFDWRHYLSHKALQTGRLSGRAKALLGLISVIAFAAALAWSMSPAAAVSLVVAVFIHELGHLAGMWMFGHRDTQMLFLPFFGAAAIAHDEQVLAPWKELVIVFLGPLPGLFLGLAALLFAWDVAWVREAASIFVALNAINLAPVLPLDGGRVLDIALANRFPRVRIAFVVVSAIAMILFGWLAGMLLVALGIGMLLRLAVEWRTASMVNDIRREGSEGAEEEPVVRRLLQRLREPEWARVPMPQRLNLARRLQVLLRQPIAGFGTIALALFLYLSPLAMLVGLGVVKGAQLLWAGAVAGGSAAVDPHGPKFAYQAPQPTAEQLASTDNAAPKFAAALDEYARLTKRAAHGDDDLKLGEALPKALLPLLREAAAGKFFAVDPKAVIDAEHYWHQASAVELLLGDAFELDRAGETKRAQERIVECVRLVRLLRTVPARWTASADSEVVTMLMELLEEASARGETWDATTRAWLGALFDETAYVTYARVARPMEGVTALAAHQAHLKKRGEDGEADMERMFLKVLGHTVLDEAGQLARAHAFATATQQGIDGAMAGRWPTPPAQTEEMSDADTVQHHVWSELIEFSADLTRVRLAHTALLILDQRATSGRQPAGFAEIQNPKWKGIPIHPRTRQPLQWSVTDERGVLEFPRVKPAAKPEAAAPAGEAPGEDEDAGDSGDVDEYTGPWRLPKR